jgi:hypothetical protein
MTSRIKRHSSLQGRRTHTVIVRLVRQFLSENLVQPDLILSQGVITKPDMLSAGSSQARRLWLDVVEGRRHPLTHGYYCTRQPDDDERLKKITTAEAREAEVNFFNRTAPWKESKYQARFGTANLVATLSVLLVRIITES